MVSPTLPQCTRSYTVSGVAETCTTKLDRTFYTHTHICIRCAHKQHPHHTRSKSRTDNSTGSVPLSPTVPAQRLLLPPAPRPPNPVSPSWPLGALRRCNRYFLEIPSTLLFVAHSSCLPTLPPRFIPVPSNALCPCQLLNDGGSGRVRGVQPKEQKGEAGGGA